MEELLAELKEVLKDVQEWREVTEKRGSTEGGLRGRLLNLCKDALVRAVTNTREELVKVCNVISFGVLLLIYHQKYHRYQCVLQPSS